MKFEICQFCSEICETNHLCAKLYIFENIFKHFFMSILLDSKPKNGIEFWNVVIDNIIFHGLFTDSPDPRAVIYENLIYFMTTYDCFS